MEAKEIWDRLESLEDLVLRMLAYGALPEPANRDYDAENQLIQWYRNDYPYKSGDPEHYKNLYEEEH